MIRCVVFDLDGTLVDSFEDIAHAANFALSELGVPPLPTSEVKRHVGRGLENLLRGILPEGRRGELPRALELTKAYYAGHPTDFSVVYAGGIELLDGLKDLGVVRVVLSNKVDVIVQSIALQLGLAQRLEEVWGHREGFPLKPDPTSLLHILDKHQIAPSDCIVVGDGAPDRELAEAAGAGFVPVNYGIVTEEQWRRMGRVDSQPSLTAVDEWIRLRIQESVVKSGRK